MSTYPTPVVGDHLDSIGAKKGWPQVSVLDTGAPVDDGDLAIVKGGSCVHVNDSYRYEAGASGVQMPLFLARSPTAFDVATDRHNSHGVAVTPRGYIQALVGKGDFELESSQFDSTKSWKPNDPIVSPTKSQISGADKSDAGRLFKTRHWNGGSDAAVQPNVDKIVGVASWGLRTTAQGPVTSPAFTSPYGHSVLAFWPVFTIGSN